MKYYVQYHNFENLGFLPGDYDWNFEQDLTKLDTSQFDLSLISTKKPGAEKSVGDVVFLIIGYFKSPKKYVLWSWGEIVEVSRADSDGWRELSCEGNVLNPPAGLKGKEFDEFKRDVGNFGFGFQNITSLSFTERLKKLAGLRTIERQAARDGKKESSRTRSKKRAKRAAEELRKRRKH